MGWSLNTYEFLLHVVMFTIYTRVKVVVQTAVFVKSCHYANWVVDRLFWVLFVFLLIISYFSVVLLICEKIVAAIG